MKKYLYRFLLVSFAWVALVLPAATAAVAPTCLQLTGNCNCYLYGQNGTGILIDAGVDAQSVLYHAAKAGLKIKAIILTHAHGDHTSRLPDLKNKTQAKVYLHESDFNLLRKTYPGIKVDGLVKGGDSIRMGGMNLEIIHTPGHTAGSICIKADNIIFSGDTLFKLSVGRTDLEGGSAPDLVASLKKLSEYDERDVVCPGHGETTTIGFEKANNWFLKNIK